MKKQTKTRLAIVAGVIVLILLWFWLRENKPDTAQRISSALQPYIPSFNIPGLGAKDVNIDFGDVEAWHPPIVPGDITGNQLPGRMTGTSSLPALPNGGDTTNCVLCATQPGEENSDGNGGTTNTTTTTTTTTVTESIKSITQFINNSMGGVNDRYFGGNGSITGSSGETLSGAGIPSLGGGIPVVW